jgi:deoxyhypusine monooxygenase
MAPLLTAPDAAVEDFTVNSLRETLLSSVDTSLSQCYRALFSLKSLASAKPPTPQALLAIRAIADGFSCKSALLKHEVAYCLGQTGNIMAAPYLKAVLQNREEDAMCRHEAAEALGALGDMENLDFLRQFRDDKMEKTVVRETCEIAVARLEWEQLKEEKPYTRYVMVADLNYVYCTN